MTQVERDNAAEVLGNMLSDIADNKLYGIKRDEINAILRSIVVLRDYDSKPAQPEQVSPTTQPDPDTGLVPCGCGGSAAYHISYDGKAWSTTVKVACNKCLINVAFSALYELRGEEALADDAKNAWNTAMGWKGGAERMLKYTL